MISEFVNVWVSRASLSVDVIAAEILEAPHNLQRSSKVSCQKKVEKISAACQVV